MFSKITNSKIEKKDRVLYYSNGETFGEISNILLNL